MFQKYIKHVKLLQVLGRCIAAEQAIAPIVARCHQVGAQNLQLEWEWPLNYLQLPAFLPSSLINVYILMQVSDISESLIQN